MLHLRRLAPLAAVAASLLSGCALYAPQRDYSPFTAILTPYDWNIIDWRFPTTVSEGPLEGPKRLIPELPAIGVPWATGNPLTFPPPDYRSALPDYRGALSGDAAAAMPAVSANDDQGLALACTPPQPTHVAALAGARADEPAVSR